MKHVVVFPGQGSQKVGMGGDLFRKHSELTDEASKILGYSVETLCLTGAAQLNQTEYTQPAVFVVNALCYRELYQLGLTPDYLIGHSLGEFNALWAAGVFDFATGVRLVKRRSELMAQCAQSGGMVAVVGLPVKTIRDTLESNALSTIDVANLNADAQTVIAGPMADLQRAIPLLESAGARLVLTLRLSAAFHSRYMQPCEKEFETFLAPFAFGKPRIPVIANVTGQPVEASQIKQLLCKQLSSPVRWSESVNYLLSQCDFVFHESGPGTILTRLIQENRMDFAKRSSTSIRTMPGREAMAVSSHKLAST